MSQNSDGKKNGREQQSRKCNYCTPLYLHRPAQSDREAYWWSDVEVMPFKLVESSIQYFEFKYPIVDIKLENLLEFCGLNQIELKDEKTIQTIAKKIIFWQIQTVERIGCFSISMKQFIEIYNCAKATPKRKTFQDDVCQLIETTGEMSLEGIWAHLSIYILTNFGIQQVFYVDFDRKRQQTWGRFHTLTGSVSSYADLPIWLERARSLDRQTFEAMIRDPNPVRLKGPFGGYKRSAAVYELEKIVWVLNARLRSSVVGNLENHSVLQHDVSLVNERRVQKQIQPRSPRVFDLNKAQPIERLAVQFKGNDTYLYLAPIDWASAIVLAYFNWARQVREMQRTTGYTTQNAEGNAIATAEAKSIAVFDQWLERLNAIVFVSAELVRAVDQLEKQRGLPEVIKNQLLELSRQR